MPRQAPQPGGYIFLWRSLYLNGHFHMPPNAFKIFIFLLLRVNHSPTQGCNVGEGWIDYEEIRRYCSEKGRGKMSNATISAALDYLERRGYIKRYREKNGVAQKIRVVNYRKYQLPQGFEAPTCLVSKQGATSSVSKQVSTPCGTSDSGSACLETKQPQHETKQKQEYMEGKKEGREVMLLVEWSRWYEEKFALFPSWKDFCDMQAFKEKGVTDDLIIALLEEALANPRIKRPLAWAKRRISDMFPRGIRTAEDYRRWKQMAEDESRGALPERKQQARQPQRRGDDEAIREVKEALLRLQHEQQ